MISLVGATLTFRVLGYSAAIRGRRGLGYAVLALAMITVPPVIHRDDIVGKLQWERSWQKERFLVNGKYIIVRDAEIFRQHDRQVVRMDILAREWLNRNDPNDLKEKIQHNAELRSTHHADRPVYVNTIRDGLLESVVKVY
jgi:hypothetical protein